MMPSSGIACFVDRLSGKRRMLGSGTEGTIFFGDLKWLSRMRNQVK